MSLARLRDPVRETLARAGIVDALGPSAFHERLTEGVQRFSDAMAAERPV